MPLVTEVVGVYDADGGLRGEATYVIGHMLGTAHCALCDITHSPIRRKPAWDRMISDLGITATLLHRNETTDEVDRALEGHGLAILLARVDGALEVALTAAELDVLDGSVDHFREALEARARDQGWQLPGA